MKLWRCKKKASKDSSHQWALLKEWAEHPNPCPHIEGLAVGSPLSYGGVGGIDLLSAQGIRESRKSKIIHQNNAADGRSCLTLPPKYYLTQ